MTDKGPGPSPIDWLSVAFLVVVVVLLLAALAAKGCWV